LRHHRFDICEVYYDLRRRAHEDAESLETILVAAGFEIVEHLPSDLWHAAGRLKAELRRISLADCFALAVAEQLHGGQGAGKLQALVSPLSKPS
jgi:predicted nucleic acid-binding protein